MKSLKILLSVLLLLLVSFTASKSINETFKVYGNCGMCKTKIENALKVDGVKKANWNIETKMLKIKYNPSVIKLEQIHQKIADAGYDTEMIKAADETYNSLHGCCKYERSIK
jgi:periplasmic mercuric ion binding protein